MKTGLATFTLTADSVYTAFDSNPYSSQDSSKEASEHAS